MNTLPTTSPRFRPASSSRRTSFQPQLEVLEQREVPATLAAIGAKFASVLTTYANTAVVAPTLRSVPESVEKAIVAEAADNLEGQLDSTLRHASALATTLAHTGAVPRADAGYLIDLNPVGHPRGWV